MRTRKEGGRGEGGHQEVPMPPRPQRPGPLFGCALARLPRRISRGGDEVLPGGPSRRQRAKGIAAGGGGGERREAALPPPCMGRHVAGAGTTPRLGELPPSGRRGAHMSGLRGAHRAGGGPRLPARWRERAGAPGRPEPRCRRGAGTDRPSVPIQDDSPLLEDGHSWDYWYVGVTPNSREPAVELLQLCPHGLLDLRRHLRESPVDIGHGDRERRDDFLLVVDVPQVHVLHVLEVDLGLPEQLVDVLARRGLLLLLLRRGALVAAAGGGGPLVPPAVQSEELVAGLLQDLGGLLDQLVHAPDLHVLVLRVLVLHEHAGVGGPLAHEKRQVHLHLGLRVHIQARDLLAHGLQPLPQALHLGVELLRRVRDDLDAVVQAHVPLLLHLRQLGELDADVALLQGLLEPLGVPEELLLADLFVLEVIEDCL
ncbi:unnamed protein product [Prorocentrum cordatum]|uniref:Uncharacterized protein n=1 Tax=Prorocentrum cordatum TaxID=2364126 RepID=A0ABN9V9R3_9DINO|nr:unnamed protein product [Polarella glacialis]